MIDYLPKLQNLLLEIERLGLLRTELLKKKVIAEARLQDKEDEVRGVLLSSDTQVTRIPLLLKNNTREERKASFEAESNYRVCNQEYEMVVEILQGVKFEIKLIEKLGG